MSERGPGFDGKTPPIDVTFTVKEEVVPLTNEEIEKINEDKRKRNEAKETVTFYANNDINHGNDKENFESEKGNGNFSGGGSGGSEKNPNLENDRNGKVERIKNVLVDSQFLKPDEKQKEEMAENLNEISNILGHEFKGVSKIDETIRGFSEYGEKGSVTEAQFKIAVEDKEILGEAADLAARELESRDPSLRSDLFMGSRHVDNGLDSRLKGLGWEISKHYISNEKIDGQLNILEITRQRTDFDNPDSVETLSQKIKKTKDKLIDLDLEDEGSVMEQDEALTVLNTEKKNLDEAVKMMGGEGIVVDEDNKRERVDERAIIENIQRKDNKEYRSPYEITPESFVDSIFNQDNPRLFFTPPPEWVAKLSSKEQYLLKIQQRLAIGAATKLGVKDISAEKARQNEIYNFPTTELGLIYEMPGVREAMETFTGELLEFYEEDGRRFLRLKLKSNGEVEDDVLHNLGHDKSGFSFEDYKEGLYLRMALKKIYPDKSDDYIKENWLELSKQEKKKYVDENKGKSRKTDAQLEFDWITKNALEEKRAVATAWNFLFVGNIIESADTTRRLKPSQVNSDKIRTMMMPLEKFMQKLSIRNEEIKGTEEFFGGSIALWARKMMDDKDQGKEFARKVIYAADHNRDEMTEEQAMWRLFPKRTMCGFCDFYLVQTKEGEKMTMSRALMEKKEINFDGDDLDVFVSLRDTWDELNTVTPFLIGKGEYSPVQQPEKYALAVEKLKGLVTSIKTIELTEKESKRQDGKKFGNENFVNCPEFYAWLISNSVGLETNLDIPVLKMSVLKADKDTYNDHVNNLVRLLNLDSKKSLAVKTILNGKNWVSARLAISEAMTRAARKESRKKAQEKKRRFFNF